MLTTVELREHLQLPPEKDPEVAAILAAVIDLFEHETHGLWNSRASFIEEISLRTNRISVVALKLRPVSSVTKVEQRGLSEVDWTEAEADDFVLEDSARIRWLSGFFLRSLRVTYAGGWTTTTVPASVKRALITQARFYVARTAGENLITASQAIEGGSTVLLKPDLHPVFAKAVEELRRLT